MCAIELNRPCDSAGQEPVQAGATAASGPGTSPPTEAGGAGRPGELPRIEKPPEVLAFEAAKEVCHSSVQRHNINAAAMAAMVLAVMPPAHLLWLL